MTAAASPDNELPNGDAGRVPLWLQVKNGILASIRDDAMPAHAALPSENDLCRRFGVSRTVVREALNQLVYEHVIYKRQGKGAFVAGRRDEQEFVGSVIGFSGELLEKHKVVTRRVLVQRVATPKPRAQALLRLPAGDDVESRVIEIERVLLVDTLPRIFVRSSIPESLAPGLEQVPLHTRSLYDVLQRQYGLVVRQAERWLEAVTPTSDEAALLGVTHTTPLLAIESCAYAESGRPIEYYQALYRSDLASLHIRVSSQPAAG